MKTLTWIAVLIALSTVLTGCAGNSQADRRAKYKRIQFEEIGLKHKTWSYCYEGRLATSYYDRRYFNVTDLPCKRNR